MSKIGCSSYSFRKSFKDKKYSWEDWGNIKSKFPDIQGFEILTDDCATYLLDTESNNVSELKNRLEKNGFELYALTTGGFDFGTNSVPFYVDHESYVNGFKMMNEFKLAGAMEWIEIAGEVGVPMMRIDIGQVIMNHKIPFSHAFDFNTDRLINFYSECVKTAAEYNIKIGFENHGGFASDRKVMEKILDAVPDLYLTLDTGNLTDNDRYTMTEQFADRINYVHAKTYVFDDNGDEPYIDFQKIITILKDHKFDGWYSIEFEGPGPEDEGVAKTIDLIKKNL
jgi:sugar phosphate isomerase/epimerase